MKISKSILIAAISIALMNNAIAHDDPAAESLATIVQEQQQQIKQLQKQLSDLVEIVYAQQNALTNAGILHSQVAQNPAAQLSKNPDKTASVPVPLAVANASKEVTHSDGVAKQAYDNALVALKNEQFAQAQEMFAQFIQDYPDSPLQSNASFWYAESFYRQNDFNKAAVYYLQSYKKFPNGTKAADSLLKLAYSLFNLQRSEDACKMIAKLNHDFPDLDQATLKRVGQAKDKFTCP
jgi:tol-pal system protein YbgF